MDYTLPATITGTAIVIVPALALLIRCLVVIRRASRVMNEHGLASGTDSTWRVIRKRAKKPAAKVAWILFGTTIVAIGISWLVTVWIEPSVPNSLAIGLYAIALAGVIVTVVFALPAVYRAREVRELFNEVTNSDLPVDHPARVAALDQLGRVTWSQTAVAGVGIAGGVVCFLFGAGVIAGLFLAATTAITCARDPKCM